MQIMLLTCPRSLKSPLRSDVATKHIPVADSEEPLVK
jgi:hypothetical protein